MPRNALKLRVVVDTNVLVSALMNGHSKSAEVMNQVVTHFVFLTCDETWGELESKLYSVKLNKYWDEEARALFLANIATRAEFVHITSDVKDCRDEDDNKFLNLALDGAADLIVSGDNDLRVLNPYQDIQILSPTDFLEKINN